MGDKLTFQERTDKNILIFVNHFHPYKGGLENIVLQLYSRMKSLYPEMKIDLICNNTEKTVPFEIYQGIHIFRADCWTILGGTYSIPKPISMFRILKQLSYKKYTMINTHTRFFINALIGAIYAKRQHVFHLHTEHGSTFTRVGNPIVNAISYLFDQTFGRYILGSADKVFTISKAVRQFAKRLGAKYPEIVNNGIDISSAVFDGNFEIKKSDNLIFVGRLVFGKGVQDLLAALKNIRSNWRLHVIGSGNFENPLKQLVSQYQFEDKVQFHGFLDSDDVHRLLAKSQIFINPSYTEGFPLSPIEAGLEGCTVIVSDVGGQPDIVDDGINGFVIPGFNDRNQERIDVLKQKLEILLNDVSLCQMFGKRLREKVIHSFGLDNMVHQYRSLICSI